MTSFEQFRGNKLSRIWLKTAKPRKFLPAKVSSFKVTAFGGALGLYGDATPGEEANNFIGVPGVNDISSDNFSLFGVCGSVNKDTMYYYKLFPRTNFLITE